MNLVVLVGEDSLDEALFVARQVGSLETDPDFGVATLVPDKLDEWLNNIWDQVEIAVREAVSSGRAAAQPAIDEMNVLVSKARSELGASYQKIERKLEERIDVYYSQHIKKAIDRIEPRITIGGVKLTVNSVKVDQSLKFSGSLKSKLDEICIVLAEGQITVSVGYVASNSTPAG